MCFSDYDSLDEPSPEVKLTLGITFLFFSIVGVVGNTVVLLIVFKVLRSRKTVPNILILFLAVTDLLTIFLAFPPALLRYFSRLNVGHAPLCNYQATAINFFYLVSVVLVACMSLDRYLALSRPFFYKSHVVFDRDKLAIAFGSLCSFALATSLLPVLGVGTHVLQYPRTFCLFQLNARDLSGKFVLYLNLSLLLVCMLTVVACNSAVSWTSFRMLRRSSQQRPSVEIEQTGSSFNICLTEECQFLKLSVLVMVTFVGFWSPFLVRVLMIQANSPFNSCWDMISIRLVTLHTISNPWIYLLTRRQYRRGFWYIIQICLHFVTCRKLCHNEHTLEEILGIKEVNIFTLEKDDKEEFSKQNLQRSSCSLKHEDKDCRGEISTADRNLLQ